ncbi:unnamed protein product [Schistosoma mattheei]|uniref:Uncharacterized protein n=1 Tax=Schistosoma mattheei TaxID=31246 RepID=A0A183P5Y2_9TREM|nr:unnamed protein product [Schistosoma mattheei]
MLPLVRRKPLNMNIQAIPSCRGAEITSDHHHQLVVVKMKLRRKKHWTSGQTALRRFNTDFLQHTDKINQFNIALNNRLQALHDLLKEEKTTMEDNWKEVEDTLTPTCQEVLGRNKHHHHHHHHDHREWIYIETVDKIQETKNNSVTINNSRTRTQKVKTQAEYTEANKRHKQHFNINIINDLMRILFRKKLTPLVTNFQANVSNICESYDVKKKDNLENIEYCKIEYTNSAEKDVISGYNSSSHSLPINNNEKNNLTKDKNYGYKINEDLSCLTESNLCEKENLSGHMNSEPLTSTTTQCLNEQKLKIHENDSLETVENVNKLISNKNELIKEVTQITHSKLSTFPIINNNNNENKLLRRIKTERHYNNHNNVQFNTIEKNCQLSTERLKIAKDEVDEAIKSRKIFSILGPYNRIRKALRTRGWIEKFDVNIGPPGQTTQESKKTIRSIANVKTVRNSNSSSNDTTLEDSEDGDSDDDVTAVNEEKQRVQPWEEDSGYYGLLSRMVRSELPRFIWSLRKNQVDFQNLQKDQIINHHSGAPFTTKVGLCRQLRQIRWFADCNADYFFPRCFIISEEDDRQSFISKSY